MKYEPTPDLVKEFWGYMASEYKFKTVQKADASEMRAIAWALNLMGVQSKKKFLNSYTTTIGRTMYLPFVIGVEGGVSGISLEGQISTCVHECVHVTQYRRGGSKFVWEYLTSPAARAHYEVDAYRSNMEMYFWATGKILDPRDLAAKLAEYGCSKADIRVAAKNLEMSARVIAKGGVVSGPTKKATAWFEQHASDAWKNTRIKPLRVGVLTQKALLSRA